MVSFVKGCIVGVLSAFLFCLFVLFNVIETQAQNSVTIGSNQTLPKAVLSLIPNGKQGFLPPQLSISDTVTFGSLGVKYAGLMFYDTVNQSVMVYSGTKWQLMTPTSPNVGYKKLIHQTDNCYDNPGNSFDTIFNTQVFIPLSCTQVELRFKYISSPVPIQLRMFVNNQPKNATLPANGGFAWRSEVFNINQTGWVDLVLLFKTNTNPPGAQAEICQIKVNAL